MTGTTLAVYTLIHVVLSLVGIGAGLVVLYGLLQRKRFELSTRLFLFTTVSTSLTGYGFPVEHFMPSHVVDALSLVALGIAIFARYVRHLEHGWRRRYVISAMVALYFNSFVFVVQAFEKVPALKALSPTQQDPAFGIAQLLLLAAFIALTISAVKRFQPDIQPADATRTRSARAA